MNPCRPWVDLDDLDVGFVASAGWTYPWPPWEVPGVPAISHYRVGADFELEQAFVGPSWRLSFEVPYSCQVRDPGASCWEGIGLPVVEAASRDPGGMGARVAEIQIDLAVVVVLAAAVEAATAHFYSEAVVVVAASFVAVEAVASASVGAVEVPGDHPVLP